MRFWCHQPTHPQRSGERPGQGRDDRPAGPCRPANGQALAEVASVMEPVRRPSDKVGNGVELDLPVSLQAAAGIAGPAAFTGAWIASSLRQTRLVVGVSYSAAGEGPWGRGSRRRSGGPAARSRARALAARRGQGKNAAQRNLTTWYSRWQGSLGTRGGRRRSRRRLLLPGRRRVRCRPDSSAQRGAEHLPGGPGSADGDDLHSDGYRRSL